MIASPTGNQRLSVHGQGPKSEEMTVSQMRDAAGYMKAKPLPAREVTIPGVVKLAGSAVQIKADGILDGNLIKGLAATDGLVGAGVAGTGVPDGATVLAVTDPALPNHPGTVSLSNAGPPASNMVQPFVFSVTQRVHTISGLHSTDGLKGARVAADGVPEGTLVQQVTSPAIVATNTRPGTSGEVALTVPVVPIETAAPLDRPSVPLADVPLEISLGRPPETTPAPPPPPPPPAEVKSPPIATLTPVDIKFSIPSEAIVIPDGVSRLMLAPVEPIAALTVTLPAAPVDGQLAFIYSTMEIGELTVLAGNGHVLNWTPAPPKDAAKPSSPPEKPPFLKLAADSGVGYLFSTENSTWDRIQ